MSSLGFFKYFLSAILYKKIEFLEKYSDLKLSDPEENYVDFKSIKFALFQFLQLFLIPALLSLLQVWSTLAFKII